MLSNSGAWKVPMTAPNCCTSTVVRSFGESGARGQVVQGGVRTVKIIVMEKEWEEGIAVETGVVLAGIGPLPSDGLDEAFGLAVGLRPVRTGEAMLEAELTAGVGEELGAIRGAAVGEDALNGDAMSFVEVDGLVSHELPEGVRRMMPGLPGESSAAETTCFRALNCANRPVAITQQRHRALVAIVASRGPGRVGRDLLSGAAGERKEPCLDVALSGAAVAEDPLEAVAKPPAL